MSEHLSIAEIADRCGVHPKTVHRWMRTDPDFPEVLRLGQRTLRVPAVAVDEWLASKAECLFVDRSAVPVEMPAYLDRSWARRGGRRRAA